MGVPGLWECLAPSRERRTIQNTDPHKQLKIAVDVSIWIYQCQSAIGGASPDLRTFFYRLCRLLTANIRAVFVFDGPAKPKMKRKKISSQYMYDNFKLRSLIAAFGFTPWRAPGEAEAECARLQILGYVDAVLSNDVDALLFGARTLYTNWAASKEEKKPGRNDLLHTNVYEMLAIEEQLKLNQQDLILIALLAGGDYGPGMRGCGIKLALEIVRAGYAESLFVALTCDGDVSIWREKLTHDLQRNSLKTFSRSHPSLHISNQFPDMGVLQLYMSPTVSDSHKLSSTFADLKWRIPPDCEAIRHIAQHELNWTSEKDARHLDKFLAQSVLFYSLSENRDAVVGLLPEVKITASRSSSFAHDQEELKISCLVASLLDFSHTGNIIDTAKAQPSALRSSEILDVASPNASSSASKTKTATEESSTNEELASINLWVPKSLLLLCYGETVHAWQALRLKQPNKPSRKKKNAVEPGQLTLDAFWQHRKTAKSMPKASTGLQRLPPDDLSRCYEQSSSRNELVAASKQVRTLDLTRISMPHSKSVLESQVVVVVEESDRTCASEMSSHNQCKKDSASSPLPPSSSKSTSYSSRAGYAMLRESFKGGDDKNFVVRKASEVSPPAIQCRQRSEAKRNLARISQQPGQYERITSQRPGTVLIDLTSD